MSPPLTWKRGLFTSPAPYIAILFALLSGSCGAQSKVYKPWLEQAILKQSKTIVVARFERATRLPSKETLHRFKVKKRLKGTAEKSILVIGAERSIMRSKLVDKILFLKTSRHGSFQVVVDFVDLPDGESVNRVDFLEAYIKAVTFPKRSKADSIKQLAMAYLQSKSPWVRRVLVRELYRLAVCRSDLFNSSDLSKVERIVVADLGKDEKRILTKTRVAIEEGNALRWTRSKLIFPTKKIRNAYLADLALFEQSKDVKKRLQFMKDSFQTFKRKSGPLFARLLKDPMTQVVQRSAYYLGELESGAGIEGLQQLALSEQSDAVRRAAIVAIGKIAAPRSTTILAMLLGKGQFQKAVVKGLVSIGTDASLETVRSFDLKLRRDPDSSPDLRVFVAKVLGKEFREKLRQERRARKAKYGR